MSMMRVVFASFVVGGVGASVSAAPVDLSSWLINGTGNWILETTNQPNDSARQTLNSAPTVLHNNQNSQGTTLSGTITPLRDGDDDFIGFVLGYTDGDITNSGADTPNAGIDYLLFDWKQGTQSGWTNGTSLSRVTGDIRTCGTCTVSDAWQHTGDVDLITRGLNFGNVGYVDNTSYQFDILFSASRVKIDINGATEFDILASTLGAGFQFSDGAFGFYNFSQPNVRYAGITSDNVPDDFDPPTGVIPVPAGLPLMLAGCAAFAALRTRKNRKQEA